MSKKPVLGMVGPDLDGGAVVDVLEVTPTKPAGAITLVKTSASIAKIEKILEKHPLGEQKIVIDYLVSQFNYHVTLQQVPT